MDSQLINFTIPKNLLFQMDTWADKESRSRSELIREAIRQFLEERQLRKRDFDLILQSARRVNLGEEEAFDLIEKVRDELPMNQK